MTSSDQVVVAGAGPVGLTAALLLADAGVPVTVLEKRAELSAASKASTFHPPTLAILHHLRVLDAVRDRGAVARRVQYRTGEGVFAEFSLDALAGETAFPYRLHLEQAQVTPLLLARLRTHAHVRVLFGAEVLDVAAEDGGVRARIRHAGVAETIAGAFLVGADGSRSDVRRALGIAFEGEDYPDKILRVMTDEDLDRLLPGIAPVTYLFHGGKSVSFLRMPDCWRIILRVAKDVDDATALAPEWILARLREVIPHCDRLPAVVMKDVYGVARRVAARYRAGRVVLAGDAAHITNTRGGMNMNCGLHDAYAIALAIVRAWRGEGPDVVAAAADERHRVATTMLIPRTDRNVAGGQMWLEQVRSMAADPAQALAYLRTTAMLDMTAVPAAALWNETAPTLASLAAPRGGGSAAWGGPARLTEVAMPTGLDPVRPTPWAGVLVPPANPSVEPELQRLLMPAMTLYAARFAVMPGTTLEERNRRYLEQYREAVTAFGDLGLAAMVIGLTGPSYRLLPAGDIELTRELTRIANATPVTTASRAIAEALAALGARRLCLFSPYPDWLTAEAVAYWREAGHEVVQVVKVSETFRAYQLTNDEVAAALSQVDHDAIDATVMSGTGMLTLPSIVAARHTGAGPILSSNLCSAWWLLRTAAQAARSPWFERAAPELAATLAG